MKRSGKLLVALLVAGSLVASPGQAGAAPDGGRLSTPTVKSLLGKRFVSVKTVGNPLLKKRKIGLRFFMHANNPSQPKKPTMGVSGGCNSFGSGFRIRKGRLASRGRFVGTAIGCKPNPDPWLMGKLKKGLKARTNGKRLILTRPAEGVKLVFRRVSEARPDTRRNVSGPEVEEPISVGEPATAESLQGKTFESVKVIGRQLETPIKLGFIRGKTQRFDDEGKQLEGPLLTARLGCNWMGGEYRIEDGQLNWFDVVSTSMSCQYDHDGWYYNLLNKGVKATVDGTRLVLTRHKTQIILAQVS